MRTLTILKQDGKREDVEKLAQKQKIFLKKNCREPFLVVTGLILFHTCCYIKVDVTAVTSISYSRYQSDISSRSDIFYIF